MATHQKRALVTGGAGLIGSHIVDLLLSQGWTVRILDNLEPNTHKLGKPAWVNPRAEFRLGNVQDYDTMHSALLDIDVVWHEAAYGGYMPEMAKYVLVNSFGTAQMLEIIRDHNLPVKKVVVASSQAVYSEGAARCPEHGAIFPLLRPADQLRAGDFSVHCPVCAKPTRKSLSSSGASRLASPRSRCATPAPTARGSRSSTPTPA
jgi:dTDP-L-rhamnose 4-epimerase